MHRSSLPRRVVAIAACLGAAAAVHAAPALAAPTPVTGEPIFASGSSLQKTAQLGLTTAPFNFAGLDSIWANSATDLTWTNKSTLGGPVGTFQLGGSPAPKITYSSTSSGGGLGEFGNTTGAFVQDDATAAGTALDGFIGSDDPPTAAQLANAATASGGVNEVTTPVFQAPIALAVSLPPSITISGKLDLSNTMVRDIYDNNVPAAGAYAVNTWGAVLVGSGLTEVTTGTPTASQFKDTNPTSTTAGGSMPIVLEVRNGGSGTTYSIQGFLSISGDTTYSGFSDSEALWPSSATDGCSVGGTGACATAYAHGNNAGSASGNSGSGALVKNVLADPGTIGYVNLADAAGDVVPPAGTTCGGLFTDLPQTTTYSSTCANTTGAVPSAAHQFLFAAVQDNYTAASTATHPSGATYAEPGTVNEIASPATVSPNVYIANRINTSGAYSLGQSTVGDWVLTSTPNGISFGNTVPSDPDVFGHGGGLKYPIIAATYEVAWQDYVGGTLTSAAPNGYGSTTNAQAVGNTVISFLAYLTGTGQANLVASKTGYAKLPTPIVSQAKLAWEGIKIS